MIICLPKKNDFTARDITEWVNVFVRTDGSVVAGANFKNKTGQVYIFNPQGDVIKTIKTAGQISGLAVSTNGLIAVTSNEYLYYINSLGTIISKWGHI